MNPKVLPGEAVQRVVIRRLTDVYGLDAVNAFVFNEKTFDEAFGVDYETARDAWIAWLTETYPIE